MSLMSLVTARSTAATVLLFALLAAKAQEFRDDSAVNKHSRSSVDSHEVRVKVDTAVLSVIVNPITSTDRLDSPVDILFLSDYCYTCSPYIISTISGTHGHYNTTFLVDSRWGSTIMIRKNATTAGAVKCSIDYPCHFEERANYELKINISDKECTFWQIERLTEPYGTYIPIAVAAGILAALAIIYTIIDTCYTKRERYGSVERFINSDLGSPEDVADSSPPTPPPRPVRERMVSVDTFRGACIVIMVFVNYKGGRYWFFHHAAWHGLTVADLVFPWFMFIMGINIVLSIDSLLRKDTSAKNIAYKIIRRTLILFFLGLCIINHNTDFVNMRIPGVLQRFAVAYLVVALIQWAFHISVSEVTTRVVMATSDEGVRPWWYQLRDFTLYWPQWIIIACFEVVWHCLTFLLPIGDCPKGYLGPGGLAENGTNFNCIGGAAAYIDLKVFGKDHIYSHPTAMAVYYPPSSQDTGVPFDPEGLLGSFHSILIVFLGLQAGKIFLYYNEPKGRIVRWLAWSLIMGVISAILTKCSQYDGWIPVNKNLWTTSFVTTLSCFAYFILAVMYYIIDVKKWWTGVPFYYVGMNSILVYVGHEVFSGYIPFAWGAGATSTHAELLAMNMLGTAYWVLIAYYCYKIKFFVKI